MVGFIKLAFFKFLDVSYTFITRKTMFLYNLFSNIMLKLECGCAIINDTHFRVALVR